MMVGNFVRFLLAILFQEFVILHFGFELYIIALPLFAQLMSFMFDIVHSKKCLIL
jgi:hypothetical protein